MSFLNPVNEPVLRFSSTDAGAPQINYNARVAGDVKAVLKACLVTGYGSVASAGWSIVNEVDHVAEFVSPSAAMSDYRLGIDDTSASSTTWYYQYQQIRTNPTANTISKVLTNITKTSSQNGWQLLVTERGLLLIEFFHNPVVSDTVARITYIGQVKSALIDNNGVNIFFWNVGHGSTNLVPAYFFRNTPQGGRFLRLNSYGASIQFQGANISSFVDESYYAANTKVSTEVVSALYIYSASEFIAQQPALLMRDNNSTTKRFGVYDVDFEGRPAINIPLTYDFNTVDSYNRYTRTVLVYLDYWEY